MTRGVGQCQSQRPDAPCLCDSGGRSKVIPVVPGQIGIGARLVVARLAGSLVVFGCDGRTEGGGRELPVLVPYTRRMDPRTLLTLFTSTWSRSRATHPWAWVTRRLVRPWCLPSVLERRVSCCHVGAAWFGSVWLGGVSELCVCVVFVYILCSICGVVYVYVCVCCRCRSSSLV